jgi:hypothetical protein
MVSSFQLGFNETPEQQNQYYSQEQALAVGNTRGKIPYSSVVLPSIFKNAETMSDYANNVKRIDTANQEAFRANEQMLSIDELKVKYPNTNFNGPMYAETAKYIAERQARLQELEQIKEMSTVKTPGAMFIPEIASYITKSFADPLEVGLMVATAGFAKGASALIPALTRFSGTGLAYKLAGEMIPQNALIAELGVSKLPFSIRTASRFYEGFVENALSNALVEPWMAGASRQLGDDYTAMNSLMNVFVGGLTGGVFHTGMGLISDPFTRVKIEDKLKSAAEYIAIRQSGEDGVIAHAQHISPLTSLSIRDIATTKDIEIKQLPDGQYQARFRNETGLLKNKDGIIGRSSEDAIRNLKFSYATMLQDGILFRELDSFYNKESVDFTNLDPFKQSENIRVVKNGLTVTRGGTKFKLQFDSNIDKLFYNINKILSSKDNKGKEFKAITYHKDILDASIDWLTTNIGDFSETDIRQQAAKVSHAINSQIKESLNSKENKLSATIKLANLEKQKNFLSKEDWFKRLEKQKDILLGANTEEAFRLLDDLHKADLEVQKLRAEKLKTSRADIQRLIATSNKELKFLSEREQIKKSYIDAIKATGAKITDEQLANYFSLVDVMTGDFVKYFQDYGISFVNEADFQNRTEKRLHKLEQSVISPIRKDLIANDELSLDFYNLQPDEVLENSYAIINYAIANEDINLLLKIKSGKYDLQETLFKYVNEEIPPTNEFIGEISRLDKMLQNSHLKEDLLLYRGLPQEGSLALALSNVVPGSVIRSPGFLSGSPIHDIAYRFALMEDAPTTILRIKAPKGMFGLDIEANLGESLRFSKYKEFLSEEGFTKLQENQTELRNLGYTQEDIERVEFLLDSGLEEEILLPRDLSLKVMNIETRNGIKYIDVTPDSTLSNIYGGQNAEILFQETQKQKQNFYTESGKFEVGSIEHAKFTHDAFYSGLDLPQELINIYPELRVAQELTSEIPAEWLFHAVDRRALANRVIGEFTNKITLPQFENLYGNSFVYYIDNNTFTKYPDIAIAKTGKAVIYDIGEGYVYNARLDSMADIESLTKDIIKWNPMLKEAIEKSSDHRAVIIKKVLTEATTLTNKKKVTFRDYIKSLGGKKRKEYSKISISDGELIYSLIDNTEYKQIGEPEVLQGISPENALQVQPETIYKSIIADNINKVEIAQRKYLEALKKPRGASSPELVNGIEIPGQERQKLKENIEKAKKDRKSIIEKINETEKANGKIIKGAVDISSTTSYMIGLFEHADISTLVHETVHVFRRTILEGDILEQAEIALGVKNGRWTKAAEEQFAAGFEKYLAEGKSPHKNLNGLFNKFKTWLLDIYSNMVKSSKSISPELRSVFDAMFAERQVELAYERGFIDPRKHSNNVLKQLTDHKDALNQINKTIKDTETEIKNNDLFDSAQREELKQRKIKRLQSKLDFLNTKDALDPTEVREAQSVIADTINRDVQEKANLAEQQVVKNTTVDKDALAFYTNDLNAEEVSFAKYTESLELSPEQLKELNESLLIPDGEDLRLETLQKETTENTLIEQMITEFGNCVRGEIDG